MNSKNVIFNFLWRLAERFGARTVEFIVALVLARMLEPSVYGTIALVTVFIGILNVFVDSGLGNALIQKKDADDTDFSTVFYFNIVVCLLLYALMFVVAPFIANFYNDAELTSIIRVLSLTIVISGVKNIQQAYVSRTMQFKRFFFSTLGGTLGAAMVGIALAYFGYGVWALVAQQLFNAIVDTLILWITVKWRPIKAFSFEKLKKLFSYGWKLLISSLIDTIYNDVSQLIIGKMYSTSDLAYFNRGKQFPSFLVTNINTSIDSVLLPTMSKEQDDVVRVRNMTRRAIKTSTYLIAPLMIGLACCAEPMVKIILTDKWLECVPFVRIFCVTFMFYPIHTANLNAIKAIGRSDLFLKLEIQKKTIGAIMLISSMWFGPLVMAYASMITSAICQIINALPNKKLLNYSYLEQLKDILPGIIIAVVMGIAVYVVGYINIPTIFVLCIQILLGIVIYVSLSALLHIESFEYILNVVLSFRRKEGNRSE